MKSLIFILLLSSCAVFKNHPKGDFTDQDHAEKSLPFQEKDMSYNLLVLVDLEVMYSKPLTEWEQHLQYFLWNLDKDRHLLVAMSALDNRYEFVYASNKKELAPKHKEMNIDDLKAIKLTSVEKIKKQKTAGVSFALNKLKFLSSRGYFAPHLDTHVLIITAGDDWDYYSNMNGQIVRDHLPLRFEKLKQLNQDIYTGKLEKVRYYDFRHLRFHTIAPHNRNCGSGRKDFFRYRLTSKEMYENFVEKVPAGTWPDYYNFCYQSLSSIFKDIYESIRLRKYKK